MKTTSPREFCERNKDVARAVLRITDAVAERIAGGEFGVAMRHRVEFLRNSVEVLSDAFMEAEYIDSAFADDELRLLVADLHTRVTAFEERFVAGAPN